MTDKQQLLNVLAAVLMDNMGNRVTRELVQGILVTFGQSIPSKDDLPEKS